MDLLTKKVAKIDTCILLQVESKKRELSKLKPNSLTYSVIAPGFEPGTVCLEGRCSIQLSYATNWMAKVKKT